MSKFTEKVRSIFKRSRPVTREEAIEMADWVNEGGAPDPDGHPRVVEEQDEGKRD